MTSGQSDQPHPIQPGQRALGAMESAVLRARSSQGMPGSRAGAEAPNRQPPPAFHEDGRNSRLVVAVALVAVLVVGSGIALAVASTRGTGGPSPTAAPTSVPGRNGGSPAANRAPKATTTTTTTAAPGTPPQISSLSPASGSPGQTVTVNGAQFLSSNGSIVATFNGQSTATACPSQHVCTVTVPPPSAGETSARVIITTSSGASNVMTFSYS